MVKGKKGKSQLKVTTVNIPKIYLEAIQKLIEKEGIFPSRSEFVRVAVHDALEKYLKFKDSLIHFTKNEIEEFNKSHDNMVRVPISDKKFEEFNILEKLEKNDI